MRAWMTCVVLSSAAFASAGQCRYLGGAERVLAPGRIVLVGEIHGTREMPEVLVALAGRAVERGLPVDVGFELDPPAQAALERYMKTGSLVDRFAVVAPRVAYGDGTSSVALLDAFTSLRAMRGVRFFTFAAGRTNQRYADNIRAARRPDAVTFAFMGASHAQTKRVADDDEDPVGMVLGNAKLDVVSISIDFTHGAAYNKGPDGARVYDEGVGTAPNMKPYTLEHSPDPAYDLMISVGEIHPSPPASKP